MRTTQRIFLTLLVVIGTTFSLSATAQETRLTIPRATIEVNQSGPYAGMFDELLSAITRDFLNNRPGSVLNKLSGNGPFTVFAPTDGAFQGLLQVLSCNGIALADIPAILRLTLQYHATRGALMAADVVAAPEITMLNGIKVTQEGGVITDAVGQQANILVTDLVVDNGVIHVIDTVLIPADLGLSACGS